MEPWDSSSPFSHPTQSPSPLPKLHIVRKVRNIELASVKRVLRVYLAGLLTIDSTINIPVVVYLAYGSTANFRFRGSIA